MAARRDHMLSRKDTEERKKKQKNNCFKKKKKKGAQKSGDILFIWNRSL